MKLSLGILLGVLGASLAATSLAAEVNADHVTAADLLAFCAADESDPTHATAKAFCYGYVDGALDYHAALVAGPKYQPLTCPPAGVTREDVAVAVIAWAGSNPYAADATPVELFMQAAVATWPCQD